MERFFNQLKNRKFNTTLFVVLILLTFSKNIFCQNSNSEFKNSVNLLFGLNQVLIDGFNIEANIFYKRIVIDYSHGISLDLKNDLLSGDEAEQGLAVHLPYSTGFGIGYRITEWLNIRVEPKWHKFEIYYDVDYQDESTKIKSYNTFSLGIGAYVDWKPFKNSDNFLKGIIIAPSIRYWPKLSSTLDNDKFEYQNKITNKTETHEAMEVGIGNSPFIVNVSIGYSIEF